MNRFHVQVPADYVSLTFPAPATRSAQSSISSTGNPSTLAVSHLTARRRCTQGPFLVRVLTELLLLHVHNRRAYQQCSSGRLFPHCTHATSSFSEYYRILYFVIDKLRSICFTRKLFSLRPGLWLVSGYPPTWSAGYQKHTFYNQTLRAVSTPSLIKARRQWPFV